MGVGKGHTIRWLDSIDLLSLDAFVNVDPDVIRKILPEFEEYNIRNNQTMGYLTQKEVGYISEVINYYIKFNLNHNIHLQILTYDALRKLKNVLVDGSLRDTHWYLKYFNNLREKFGTKLKMAIMNVIAPKETVLTRAMLRSKVSGRIVPNEVIIDSMKGK